MSSDRPETSLPRTSEAPSQESDTTVPSDTLAAVQWKYTPHVFDLLPPIRRARHGAKAAIPSAFLQSEAVDSSLLLGHGASFTVTRQTLPAGPAEVSERVEMGGWTVTTVTPAPYRPQYIVYKTARVHFQANGEPVDAASRRALQSLLTEFHALLHPPLRAHPNIIDYLGLAWASSRTERRQRLPVLVVEYGDRGTLADVQLRGGSGLADALKQHICLGIARGLAVLHANGIVHGDVKPENIIMCAHAEHTLVPKLADFGFAIIESSEAPQVRLAGTRTWRAPESYAPLPVARLRRTDIYSFGLVAWSIAIDGRSPFDLMLPPALARDAQYLEMDRLKSEDKVLPMSNLDCWGMKWALSMELMKGRSQMPREHPQALARDQALSTTSLPQPPRQLLAKLLASLDPQSAPAQLMQSPNTVAAVVQTIRQREYYSKIETIFANTLTKSPETRSLEAVIHLLEGGETSSISKSLSDAHIAPQADASSSAEMPRADTEDVDSLVPAGLTIADDMPSKVQEPIKPANSPSMPVTIQRVDTGASASSGQYKHETTDTDTNLEHFKCIPTDQLQTRTATRRPDWSELGFKKRLLSWQLLRDLEPGVQTFVANTLRYLNDTPSRFALGTFTMNGLGLVPNVRQALLYFNEAAAFGHPLAQAYLYRLFRACGEELASDAPLLLILKLQAVRGSRMALADLKTFNPEEGRDTRELLKHGYGGVGTPWFNDDQLYHGLTQPMLMSKEFQLGRFGSQADIRELKINVRGDRFIHVAAAICAYNLLNELLTVVKVDVNQLNDNGETALLCACRSGHPDIVKILLDAGADASLQSKTGESPLHWLIAFDDVVNPAHLGKDLVERGKAQVSAFTSQRVSYSDFPATIDVDFKVEGTPLLWAVHENNARVVAFLLSAGSDPNWEYPGTGISALGCAAHYHYKDCLKLMLEHLEGTAGVPTQPDGTTIARNVVLYGPLIRKAVHASDKVSMIFRNGPCYLEQLRSTLEYLQEKTRRVNFSLGIANETLLHFAASEAHDEACEIILDLKWRMDEINTPAGMSGLTALLESVRWNRPKLFRLLRSHGADVTALALNPYDERDRSWSALHIFAEQAHDEQLELVDELISKGVPVDGTPEHDIETPLQVAVRRGAFRLADKLRGHGAKLNESRPRSSLIVSLHPLTCLGQVIALNARASFHSLRYLLAPHDGLADEQRASFIVEPARGLSALHLCAMVPDGLSYAGSRTRLSRRDFDWETNRTITHELLEWFRQPDQLNLRSGLQGKTALHLAAEFGNMGVIEELTRLKADKSILCETGESPADIARRVFANSSILSKLRAFLE